MRLWRITGRGRTRLDGSGARRTGGRWNSKGVAVVYTSGTLALAVIEKLVHLDPDVMPIGQVAIEIEMPDALVETFPRRRLPRYWRHIPAPASTQRLGDTWVAAGRSAVLAVPSVLVPRELNYLINPQHRDARRIKVVARRAFSFDPRLFGAGR
jgi:RES domain-containing protein